MMLLVPILVVIFATFIGAFGSLYLKKGSKHLRFGGIREGIESFLNRDLIIGIALYVLSSIFYVGAMKFGELSILYPITSLSYVWISFISVKALGEHMNRYKWAGIALIILGVVFITI